MKKLYLWQKIVVIVGAVLFIAAIIFILFYFSGKQSLSLTSKTSDSTSLKDKTTEKLIFATIGDNVKEIVQIDPLGQNRKVLFSDKDEEQKIRAFGGFAPLSQEILVSVGNDPIGSLEIVSADGLRSKKIINDSFGSVSYLAISPDGQTIAYINQTGGDPNTWSLYTLSRNNTNRRRLLSSDQELRDLSWSREGDKIALTKTSKSGESIIEVINVDDAKTTSIFSVDHPILSLHWNENNLITFSIATQKANAGEIWQVEKDGSRAERIYENKNALPVYAAEPTDATNIAFLLLNYGDNLDVSKSADLYLNGSKASSANIILGWLP